MVYPDISQKTISLKIFVSTPKASRLARGPLSLIYNWYLGLAGAKWQMHEAECSSPSSAEVGVVLNFTTSYNNYTDYPLDASLPAMNVTV